MSNDGITELDEYQKKVLPRIEALLRLADKGRDSEDEATATEAASAAAKAQELLVAYNLSADMLGQGNEDGLREEQKLTGGYREFERDLWYAVAQLNFCLYFSSGTYEVTAYKRTRPDGSKYIDRQRKYKHLHRLVGRRVNVLSTINMAQYLEAAIERLVDERIGPDSANQRWHRHNIAFREGAASTITNKLYERRRQLVAEEEQKAREAEERAQQEGAVSTSTALTIATHQQQEKDANNDFANGWEPGTTARHRAEWQAEMADRAERERIAREEHVRWCEENPEEARRMEEEQRKEQEEAEKREARNARRRKGRSYHWTQADEREYAERSHYSAGREAGESISIDQQADHKKTHKLG